MKRPLLFLLALILATPSVASAATRYVRKTGSGSACTLAAPCLTIAQGISGMSGGDILIIGDGTYNESITSGVPNGSAGAYTRIQAENVHGVTIVGKIQSTGSYLQFEGIKVNGNLSANPVIFAYGGHHQKYLKMAAYGASSSGNVTVVDATGASDILFEDVWAWGTGRYKIGAYDHSNRVIFRRCVARHDYHDYGGGGGATGGQSALFVSYDSADTQFQNCIGIDSTSTPTAYGTLWGAFWQENNATTQTPGKIRGSIILNVVTSRGASIYDPKRYGNYLIENTVIWNSLAGYSGASEATGTPAITFTNMTIGNIWGTTDSDWSTPGWGEAIEVTREVGTVRNSIIDNTHSYGLLGNLTSDYNYFYRNARNFGADWNTHLTPSQGAHDVTNVDPRTSSLRYLPRIENGSPLKTAGSGGAQVGAQIMYQWGVSGTLYGETGWDTLTSVPLWPWPNEAFIKADFASYSGPGPSGARGFATGTSKDGTPQSLTKYIWEYLGNTIPSDIYGSTNKFPKPPNIMGISGN